MRVNADDDSNRQKKHSIENVAFIEWKRKVFGFLCATSVFSVVIVWLGINHHRDTEYTEVAQRSGQITIFVLVIRLIPNFFFQLF